MDKEDTSAFERRVDELEDAVIWLAEAMRSGKMVTSMPKLLKKAFEEKSRPEDKGRQDDCTNCQCSTCANRTTCKMKQDEILSDIMASPCNGCQTGQRYMPIESAHCPDYKLRE